MERTPGSHDQVMAELLVAFCDVQVGDTFRFLMSGCVLVFMRTFKNFSNASQNQLESPQFYKPCTVVFFRDAEIKQNYLSSRCPRVQESRLFGPSGSLIIIQGIPRDNANDRLSPEHLKLEFIMPHYLKMFNFSLYSLSLTKADFLSFFC